MQSLNLQGKHNMKKVILLASLSIATSASAQPFYAFIDGGIGNAQLSTTTFDKAANTWLQHPEATAAHVSDSSGSNLFRLGLGYQLHERISLEAGYESLGAYDASMTLTAQNLTGNNAQTTIKERVSVQGLGIRFVGNYPISNGFSLLGGVGVSYLNQERKNTASVKNYADMSAREGATSETVSQVSPSLLLGVNFDVNKNVSLRGWYGRYMNAVSSDSIKESHVDTLSAGLVIRW